jgi:hypothetical protein
MQQPLMRHGHTQAHENCEGRSPEPSGFCCCNVVFRTPLESRPHRALSYFRNRIMTNGKDHSQKSQSIKSLAMFLKEQYQPIKQIFPQLGPDGCTRGRRIKREVFRYGNEGQPNAVPAKSAAKCQRNPAQMGRG